MKGRGSKLPTPSERLLAAKIEQARRGTEPRSAEWYERCGELAREVGVDAGEVLEEFDERAAIRQYDVGVSRADAELLAWDDVRERFVKQRALAM